MRELFGSMRREARSTSQIKKLRAALSAMFATAVDDGLLRSNPCQGVRVPAGQRREPVDDDRAKASIAKELALLLAATPRGLAALLRVPGRHWPANQRGGRADLGAHRPGRSARTSRCASSSIAANAAS